jgi:beta-glucosidase
MAALVPVSEVELGQDIDPNASPVGSIETTTTPDTEFSPPDSPIQESGPPKEPRLLARQKLASLTQEEKVRCFRHNHPFHVDTKGIDNPNRYLC